VLRPAAFSLRQAAQEGESSPMGRESADFLDSLFAGIDEDAAANERREQAENRVFSTKRSS
jgi:hypothetical protein